MKLQNIVMNPEHVSAYYPEGPRLDRIVLHEITFVRDGPSLRLRFELQDFPRIPPKKWHPSFNTAQMTINFIGVTNIELRGWGTLEMGELRLERRENMVDLAFSGCQCRLSAHFEFAFVEKISGYMKEAGTTSAGDAANRAEPAR